MLLDHYLPISPMMQITTMITTVVSDNPHDDDDDAADDGENDANIKISHL